MSHGFKEATRNQNPAGDPLPRQEIPSEQHQRVVCWLLILVSKQLSFCTIEKATALNQSGSVKREQLKLH
jgi:hypothetical protein